METPDKTGAWYDGKFNPAPNQRLRMQPCVSDADCVDLILPEQYADVCKQRDELLDALELLLSYTQACEAMLNAKPAGQIDVARAAIAKATGEKA